MTPTTRAARDRLARFVEGYPTLRGLDPEEVYSIRVRPGGEADTIRLSDLRAMLDAVPDPEERLVSSRSTQATLAAFSRLGNTGEVDPARYATDPVYRAVVYRMSHPKGPGLYSRPWSGSVTVPERHPPGASGKFALSAHVIESLPDAIEVRVTEWGDEVESIVLDRHGAAMVADFLRTWADAPPITPEGR